jgi:hypothetical protein
VKISKVLIPVIALTSCAAAPQPDERTIPERFRGEWNSSLTVCGTPDNDSMMVVEADRIDFYESSGRVRGAFLDGPDEVLIVLEISGEEETSTALRLSVSADGSRITEYSESDEPFVRRLCRTSAG